MPAEQVLDLVLPRRVSRLEPVKFGRGHTVRDEVVGQGDVEGNDRLLHVVPREYAGSQLQALGLEGAHGVVEHDDGEVVGQDRVIVLAVVGGVGARVVVAAQDIDAVSGKLLGQRVEGLVVAVIPGGHHIAQNQGDIVLCALLECARVDLHIVGAQSLAAGVADRAEGAQTGQIDNGVVNGLNFF